MKTLIYTDGGEYYHETAYLSDYDLKKLKEAEKEEGAVGYMIGHRYWGNEKERVIVFFNERPKSIIEEEERRRENGFIGATYKSL